MKEKLSEVCFTEKNKQELLDQFATSALNALIGKMPFYDTEGKNGKAISEEELQYIKKNVTATAYEYAEWMLMARGDASRWLKENERINPEFGA